MLDTLFLFQFLFSVLECFSSLASESMKTSLISGDKDRFICSGWLSISQLKESRFQFRLIKYSDLLRYLLAAQDREKIPEGWSFATRPEIHLFFSESPAHDIISQKVKSFLADCSERDASNTHQLLCVSETALTINTVASHLILRSFDCAQRA